ncbi:hypothetical protein LZK98_09290 [Sphingomonas cannabina]|uniref:hypothetical protein n=1 Tax=Sphingomonas cannabina TaxID=2899123 RepID=UPI001F310D71|nr:hypothetical protein [Sphingomonas cannabina]UIJ47115.1 hypothetical protein LZK98_09290 [Sphingomonas cannabina]
MDPKVWSQATSCPHSDPAPGSPAGSSVGRGDRAAQSGDLRYVTSDASGNLALSDFGPRALAQLDRQMSVDRREMRQGIATAIGTAPIPSQLGAIPYEDIQWCSRWHHVQ